MAAALAELLKDPRVWRGDSLQNGVLATESTGFPALDAELPGQGWPRGAIAELVSPHAGNGVMSLLLPLMARVSREAKQIVLIAPPFIPYAPALADKGIDLRRLSWVQPADEQEKLWALEQTLREPACGAVVAWHSGSLADRAGRRLQLAAEAGNGLGFMVRLSQETIQSPFPLRLALLPTPSGMQLSILKRRGSPPKTAIELATHKPEYDALSSPLPAATRAGRISARTLVHAVR